MRTNKATDISVSTVLYCDYVTPLAMLTSLEQRTSSSIKKTVFFIDNSNPESNPKLRAERDAFLDEASKYDDVKYMDAGNNIGFGRANNIALFETDAQYHAFVNPDILFKNDALSALKEYLDVNQDAGMAIPLVKNEDGSIQQVYRQEVTVLDALNRTVFGSALKARAARHTMQNEDYSQPFQVPFGQGSFLMGRTSLLRELGGFDERFFMYLEDADLCKRINQSSKLTYVPDAVVFHKWERGSHTNRKLLAHHLKSYVTYFRKWGLKLA